jgi:hypothetical protein
LGLWPFGGFVIKRRCISSRSVHRSWSAGMSRDIAGDKLVVALFGRAMRWRTRL